jgi:drug/metabolite transporter (DMT)-like permease
VAFAYLVVFGSVIAFSAYAWLLRNAPLGRVATYAYVNPVVAIALGAVVLGETITGPMLAGAAVVVASVALVARLEARRRTAAACEGGHETAPERVSGSSVTSVSQAG